MRGSLQAYKKVSIVDSQLTARLKFKIVQMLMAVIERLIHIKRQCKRATFR